MKYCVILAGGDAGNIKKLAVENFRRNGIIIAADRGYKLAEELEIIPDVFVGDFDSFDGDIPESVEVHRSKPEKDDTDTMLAVKLAIEKGCTNILLLGGMGGRFDHTFANIQTLVYACENGCRMSMCDNGNFVTALGKGVHNFTASESGYFSLFAVSDELDIEYMRGTKYPLENYTLKNSFPLGVSNEITDGKAVISIRSGKALLIWSEK
ncbi:MAG: thiamine diphosphokinase [Ruminococcus sp.]|nr:thiamine diphosphokinase [Ruminococcus sp.]HAE53201.1 thiamine diphosphokinase [Ruminococcus sp.]